MNLDRLIEVVGQHYGYSVADLLEKGRHGHLTKVRQRIYALARIRLGLTFQEIAAKFNRHHASIIHGVRRVQSDMRIYKNDRLDMRELELLLDMDEKKIVVKVELFDYIDKSERDRIIEDMKRAIPNVKGVEPCR